MSCPSRGGSKPLHPFAVILVTIIHATIMKEVVEEERGPGCRQIGEPLLAPGGISHSGPGENRQFWPDENSQS